MLPPSQQQPKSFGDRQLSDFGEYNDYSPSPTYPPSYFQSNPPCHYNYPDSEQGQQPRVEYIYPQSNNGYNFQPRSVPFNYNQTEGSYQYPYSYAIQKPSQAPIDMK